MATGLYALRAVEHVDLLGLWLDWGVLLRRTEVSYPNEMVCYLSRVGKLDDYHRCD